MARRKKADTETKPEVKKEKVAVINKETNQVELKEKELPKKKSKSITPEGEPKDGKLYCHGHFTYHDAKEFGTDKRYCKRYLESKKSTKK